MENESHAFDRLSVILVRRLGLALYPIVFATGAMVASEMPVRAPILTDAASETHLFIIPAPRGLIIDRNGEVMAGNRSHVRALIRMTGAKGGSEDEAIDLVSERLRAMGAASDRFPALELPSPSQLRDHWGNRRALPLAISAPMDPGSLLQLMKEFPEAGLIHQTLHLRDYPLEATASHLIGYVSRSEPEPFGPMSAEEPLWCRLEGRSGLEKIMNRELTGEDGLLSMIYSSNGAVSREQIIRSPRPGKTIVLTLDAKMQQLAEGILAKAGRPGAFVVMDAMTGDLLVLASHPGFNPNQFVPGISTEAYGELLQAPGDPFFPRAYGASYPPGSVFKPIVALAALGSRASRGASLRYRCGPVLSIAGRDFHNWNDDEYGDYDVETALMRSTNTWFYQAALDTGGNPILTAAGAFGLGRKPPMGLDGLSGGTMPERVTSPHGLANLAIGQGEVLVSPLQMAMVAAGFANGSFLPIPRVVRQVQTTAVDAQVVQISSISRSDQFAYSHDDLKKVRNGMQSVVNDARGTGRKARMDWPLVSGKTGTAQWSKSGQERTLAWFIGFVDARDPFLAFAVVCEGAEGENLFGGVDAAPLAGEWLRSVYADPDTYHISPPSPAPSPPERPSQREVRATPVAKLPPPIQAQPVERNVRPSWLERIFSGN